MQYRYFSLLLGQDAQCCGHGGSSHPCNFIALGYIKKTETARQLTITIMTTLTTNKGSREKYILWSG